MKQFTYAKANTLEEAISLLASYGNAAKVLAGGTDLVPELKQNLTSPRYVVDIKSVGGLDSLGSDGGQGLRIGSLTTIRAIETSPVARGSKAFDVLAQAASKLGSVQVRNRATIGGNLCHASPSAEMAPALIALNASVRLRNRSGDRTVRLEEFFKGPGETVLGDDELLIAIEVPAPSSPWTAGVYLKLSPRKAMDLAMVGVAVVVSLASQGGPCGEIRIALGAVAPTPVRALKAEAVLRGKKVDADLLEEAAQAASRECSPISDIRASAEYRRAMVAVLTARATRQALQAASSI